MNKNKRKRAVLSAMVGCASYAEEWNHRVDAGLVRKKFSMPERKEKRANHVESA